jgi:hypothetical protein
MKPIEQQTVALPFDPRKPVSVQCTSTSAQCNHSNHSSSDQYAGITTIQKNNSNNKLTGN